MLNKIRILSYYETNLDFANTKSGLKIENTNFLHTAEIACVENEIPSCIATAIDVTQNIISRPKVGIIISNGEKRHV